jgi:hypothetical protein
LLFGWNGKYVQALLVQVPDQLGLALTSRGLETYLLDHYTTKTMADENDRPSLTALDHEILSFQEMSDFLLVFQATAYSASSVLARVPRQKKTEC